MTVGALVDAGADQSALIQTLESLSLRTRFEFVKVKRRGIGATKFRVAVADAIILTIAGNKATAEHRWPINEYAECPTCFRRVRVHWEA